MKPSEVSIDRETTTALRIEIAAVTDTGRQREENQDAFLVAVLDPDAGSEHDPMVSPEQTRTIHGDLGTRGYLLVVADGMGGMTGGATASRLAVESVHRRVLSGWAESEVRSTEAFRAVLAAAVRDANDRIRELAKLEPTLQGMGTTATVVGILDGRIHVAQVGDSRAYLVRKGEATQLTRDQSLVQRLVEIGRLTAEAADQSGRSHILLQALGSAAEVEVEMTEARIAPGDRIVVCSDGLFRQVEDHEIVGVLDGSPAALDGACRNLVELANARGGPDNITVVVAGFSSAQG